MRLKVTVHSRGGAVKSFLYDDLKDDGMKELVGLIFLGVLYNQDLYIQELI